MITVTYRKADGGLHTASGRTGAEATARAIAQGAVWVSSSVVR